MQLTVIGLGKLGLPLACLQATHHRVFGVDTDRAAVSQINRGIATITEPGIDELLGEVVEKGTLTAHSDYSVVTGTDMSLVIVPTPSRATNGSFSTQYVCEAVHEIGKAIRDQQTRHVVVICSTVMPGDCGGIIAATLETASGKRIGSTVGLVYSPEFIALGNVINDMEYPSLILIGQSDKESGDAYENVARLVAYKQTPMPSVRRMTLSSAEIAKIALNSYVTMKISFANALGEICENLPGADAQAVAYAIGEDPRVGRLYMKPGGPYGGPCFPRDNRAFALVGERVAVPMPLAKATDEINDRQIDRVARLIAHHHRPNVGIVGLSYKNGTPIIEESFGVKLAEELLQRGYSVRVFHPWYVPNKEEVLPKASWHHGLADVFGDDTVTILTLPDPDLAGEFPSIFAVENKRYSVVVDAWDCIPTGWWDETHLIRMGKAYDAY